MNSNARWAALAVGAVMAAAPALVPVTAVAATVFTVTRSDDPATGSCQPNDCSLREAVQAATDGDTIHLPPGDYFLASGQIAIGHSITIKDTGGAPATVHANGQDRVFEITAGQVEFDDVSTDAGVAPEDNDNALRGGDIRVDAGAGLQMYGGTVENGDAPAASSARDLGGGIYNAGTTNLADVIVAHNTADEGFGGGIYNDTTGNLTLEESVVEDNQSTVVGGGITNDGTLQLLDSLLYKNTAGDGGGLYTAFFGGSAFTQITASTITANTAQIAGGGIRVLAADVDIDRSTISGNEALQDGGGIAAEGSIGMPQTPANVTLHSSILAANFDDSPQAVNGSNGDFPDCEAQSGSTFTSQGYNLVGDASGCPFAPNSGDKSGTDATPLDPGLQTAAFNGGRLTSLLTLALKPGSPALNAGDPHNCSESTDQRGAPRGLGGRCDIGAYELVRCQGVVVNRVGTPERDTFADPTMAPAHGPNGILGLGGNDVLRGSPRDDGPPVNGLCGGDGNDTLIGTTSDDLLAGGPGNDRLLGGPGKDRLSGGAGNDNLSGGPGNDTLHGGPGRDRCLGGSGRDHFTSCEVPAHTRR